MPEDSPMVRHSAPPAGLPQARADWFAYWSKPISPPWLKENRKGQRIIHRHHEAVGKKGITVQYKKTFYKLLTFKPVLL